MKIAISTESTVDLTDELIKKHGLFVIPFNVILGNDEFKDGVNLTSELLYDFVAKKGSLPKTSAVTDYDYEIFFKEIFDKGYDEIIHFSLSSLLSSSYENAKRVAKKYNGKIHVIDTKSLSTGIALLALSCFDKVSKQIEIDQILKEIDIEIGKVQASFVIDNLKYLHKGGRCSSLALLGANILKIKPQIKLLEGKMVVGKKYRGKFEEVIDMYVKDILAQNNPDKKRVFVTTSSSIEHEKSVIESLKENGFEKIYTTRAGATICSHCGPNTLGVLFLNKKD